MRRISTRSWVLIALVASVIATISVLLSLREEPSVRTIRGVGAQDPTPGQEVPVSEVDPLGEAIGAPGLPSGGRYSASDVSRSWKDEYGAFGFQFTDGVMIVYQGDDRASGQAARDIKAMVASDLEAFGNTQFSTVDIRGIVALAHESGADGPASLQWLEGAAWVQIIGADPSLKELMALAASMAAPA